MLRLLLLLTIVPFLELWLLLVVAHRTHWSISLLSVIATGVVGSLMLRWQGGRALANIRGDLANGRMPTTSAADAALIFIAGVLLLTPGILTDLVAVSLLIPLTRRLWRWMFLRWLKANVRFRGTIQIERGRGPPPSSRVIDSYVVDEQDDAERS